MQLPLSSRSACCRSQAVCTGQVGWQGASDFLIRNERLGARGLHTYDFGMDYLEEGSSGTEGQGTA